MPLTDILPYMVLTAIPAFAVGWIVGAAMMRMVFVRYLRRRHGRYAA